MQKLLSIADNLIGGVVKTLLNWNKAGEAHRVSIKQNLPRITSAWDYRPKKAIRRFAVRQSAGMENADLPTPSVAKDKSDNVIEDRWFEFGPDALVNADVVSPTVEDQPTKASSSDQEAAVSAYD